MSGIKNEEGSKEEEGGEGGGKKINVYIFCEGERTKIFACSQGSFFVVSISISITLALKFASTKLNNYRSKYVFILEDLPADSRRGARPLRWWVKLYLIFSFFFSFFLRSISLKLDFSFFCYLLICKIIMRVSLDNSFLSFLYSFFFFL